MSVLTNPGRAAPTGNPQDLLGALGDGAVVTLANFSLVDSAYVGYSAGISATSGNTTEVPALGSAVIDVSRRTWIVCAPGKTADIRIMPGAVQWTPSPAQTAAQINALGLAKDTSVQAVKTSTDTVGANTTGVAKDATVTGVAKDVSVQGTTTAVGGIAAQFTGLRLYNVAATNLPNLVGTTAQFQNFAAIAPVSLTGSGLSGANVQQYEGYEIVINGITGGTAAAGLIQVLVTWFNDPADVFPVDQVKWFIPANAGVGCFTSGKGPNRGNYICVQLASQEAAGTTVLTTASLKLNGARRAAPSDDWRSDSVGVGQNSSSAKSWANTILIASTVSVPVGSIARGGLLYAGHVKCFMDNFSANGILIGTITVLASPSLVLWEGSIPQNVTGNAPTLIDLILPRAPISLSVANSGAAAGTLNVAIIADRV